jgi:hypothetical protein
MGASGFSELATIQGTIRGYRWWRLNERAHLESPYWLGDDWDPRENRAACLYTPSPWMMPLAITRRLRTSWVSPHDSPAPERECACGFYGLWDLPTGDVEGGYQWRSAPAVSTAAVGRIVFGIAEAWGRILLGSEGWRAELCRPLALFLPSASPILATFVQHYPAVAIVRSQLALVEFRPERA